MLFITRRKGEQIVINHGEILIQIIGHNKKLVNIGIQAPPHIEVDRKEVFLKKQAIAEQEKQTESPRHPERSEGTPLRGTPLTLSSMPNQGDPSLRSG